MRAKSVWETFPRIYHWYLLFELPQQATNKTSPLTEGNIFRGAKVREETKHFNFYKSLVFRFFSLPFKSLNKTNEGTDLCYVVSSYLDFYFLQQLSSQIYITVNFFQKKRFHAFEIRMLAFIQILKETPELEQQLKRCNASPLQEKIFFLKKKVDSK